jgi:hypothetical protein
MEASIECHDSDQPPTSRKKSQSFTRGKDGHGTGLNKSKSLKRNKKLPSPSQLKSQDGTTVEKRNHEKPVIASPARTKHGHLSGRGRQGIERKSQKLPKNSPLNSPSKFPTSLHIVNRHAVP